MAGATFRSLRGLHQLPGLSFDLGGGPFRCLQWQPTRSVPRIHRPLEFADGLAVVLVGQFLIEALGGICSELGIDFVADKANVAVAK